VNSRATRAGRTVLRAVERTTTRKHNHHLYNRYLCYRIVVTLIPPAGRRPTALLTLLLMTIGE
jgi:hypothetical protein